MFRVVDYRLRFCQTLFCNWTIIKAAFGSDKKQAARHGLPRWDFAPPTRRDILWAHSDDMTRKAWPCMTRLRVNRGSRLRVSRMSRISQIE